MEQQEQTKAELVICRQCGGGSQTEQGGQAAYRGEARTGVAGAGPGGFLAPEAVAQVR